MAKEKKRDWYSVQISTLRVTIAIFLLLAAGGGVTFGLRYVRGSLTEHRAADIVASARSLSGQLSKQEESKQHKPAFERAVQRLSEAESLLDQEDYPGAAEAGEESYQLLSDILDQILNRGQAGIAWFVTVDGQVEYRRGESGVFRQAHPRDFLYEGDAVRTSSSASAQIFFHYDETRFTIRPGTYFRVSSGRRRDQRSIGHMEYGWVDLDTADNPSGVTTAFSEIEVFGNTSASVAKEEGSETETVRVDKGSAKIVAVESGESRELQSQQQVVSTAQAVGQVQDVLPAPDPLEPLDNLNIDLDTTKKVSLSWSEVSGANRYALQVSRSRLFGDTIIDTSQRRGLTATLGLLDEGSYVWRVAAVDDQGEIGTWSGPRNFHVASFRGLALERDDTAPPLEVTVIMNGNIAILRGRTEPGARVELDGDPLPVAADGSFSTSASVYGFGAKTLRFRAIDSVGNFTEVKKRVRLPD